MIRIACPACDKMLRIPGSLAGRMVACPKCKEKFRVPDQLEIVEAVEVGDDPPPKRRPAIEEDEDEGGYGVQPDPSSPAPRSRRRDGPSSRRRRPLSRFDDEDERDDKRPHRGTLILILGILSIVFSCIPLAGWILGGITMSMGSADERLMEQGFMKRSGRGMTKAGEICGIIGVFLATATFILAVYLRFRHFALR